VVKFDLKSNSNCFKTDPNHSNFYRLKIDLSELEIFELKYRFEDLKNMNNFLHRSFFRFGMDSKRKIREISRLEFDRIYYSFFLEL
jgi:hypothetical protein